MKKILLLAASVFVLAGISSCKKCVECTAYNRSNNSVVSTFEYCGNKKIVDRQVEDFEEFWTDNSYIGTCK